MKHRPHRPAAACVAAIASALLLAGCSSPKDFYAAAAAQQRAEAAEAPAAETAAGAAGAAAATQATYQSLIEQMQQKSLWFASLAHIDALEQRWGVSPASTQLRADALRRTGQGIESKTMYTRLLDTPLAGAGYHGLGLLAGAEADYVRAAQLLQQAQQHKPTDALLLSDLGYAQLRAGRIAEARVPLMQAMQLKPDATQVQVNLALYLQASRQADRADALMKAYRLPEATRAAVREVARQLAPRATHPRAEPQPPAAAALRSAAPEADPPLALQTSRSSGARRIHIGVRRIDGVAAAEGADPLN
jgi:Flp pilus assembly protein TadD